MDIVKKIFKRLFRVYAHIYHTHFREVCVLEEEKHLNTCFKHFIFFAMVRRLELCMRCYGNQCLRHQLVEKAAKRVQELRV